MTHFTNCFAYIVQTITHIIDIQQKFDCPDNGRKWVVMTLGTDLRNYKCELTKLIMKASKQADATRRIAMLKPPSTTEEQWTAFVNDRLSEDFKVI